MKPEHKKYILENIGGKSAAEIAADLGIKQRKVKKFLQTEKDRPRAASAGQVRPPAKKNQIALCAALIIILGAGVYANSISGKLLWDDMILIKNSRDIRSWSNLPGVFTKNIGADSGLVTISYRPLQVVSYMINYSIGKLDPAGYHVTNILLHILTALAFFWLINIIFNNQIVALLASMLFVAHPVHTEAVSYIAGRADPLSGAFLFLSFILYLKALSAKRPVAFILMLLAYGAAILSREMSLILPALLLLYHYTFKRKLDMKVFAPVLAVTAAYIFLRATVLKAPLTHELISTTALERLPGFFVAVAAYAGILLLPLSLHMEYGNMLFEPASPSALAGIAILLLLAALAWTQRNGNRLVFFSIAWFFITILPQSNIYPTNAYMAEHWLYLPSVGFFLILANAIVYLYNKKSLRLAACGAAAALLVFYSCVTVRQNTYWRNPLAFYERTLKFADKSPRLNNDYGVACFEAGKNEKAIEEFKKAVELDPNYAEPRNNLGFLYISTGRPLEAVPLFKEAMRLSPTYIAPYVNLGKAYNALGRKDEAIEEYKRAIGINPNTPDIYLNLGIVYSDTGRRAEAIEAYKKALELNPYYSDAYNNLANVYRVTGMVKEAIGLYEKALEIDPDSGEIYYNLGIAYNDMGDEERRDAAFKKAEQLGVRR